MSDAPSIVVLTGAGISADSGLATFRGAGGLWEGHPVQEVATPQAWDRDPALVWRFYQHRRAGIGEVEPNAAHATLAHLQRSVEAAGARFALVTQNVDDLHERAGSQPIHMHGELAVLRCQACGHRDRDLEHLDPDTFLPCPQCDYPRLRPDVVWFGEVPYHLDRIEALVRGCSAFLSIGTSGVVYPAAGYLALARAVGAYTFVNSLDPPDNMDPADAFRPGRAVDVVPALADEVCEALGIRRPHRE